MAWQDEMRPASFRGVAFKVERHSRTLGRRTEVHQYALKDEAWAEDLGRMVRRWRVDAYVIGPDYMAQRDALAEALEAGGPGRLVHPWLGTLSVSVDGEATQEEDRATAGQAVFSITFVESGANLAPAIVVDTAVAAKAAGATTSTVAAAMLPKSFSIAGLPAFVSGAGIGLIGQSAAALQGAIGGIAPAISSLGGFTSMIQGYVSQAAALVAIPANLAGQVLGLVGQVRALASNPLAALPGLRGLMGFGGDLALVLGDTPSRARQRANQSAFVALVRRAAAAEAVAAVSEIDFASYDQAAAIRDDLATAIDALALEAGDAGEDEAFIALADLRVALIEDVTARGGSLARVFAYTPGQTEPALVIAHRIYGDADRADEIVARNSIAHPGFVPAGRPLELLSPAEAAR